MYVVVYISLLCVEVYYTESLTYKEGDHLYNNVCESLPREKKKHHS